MQHEVSNEIRRRKDLLWLIDVSYNHENEISQNISHAST